MRIAVTGATGNVGVQVVRALARRTDVEEVVGIARRRPFLDLPKVTWREADVSAHHLEPLFRGCQAVVHLAWLLQPSRDRDLLERNNVEGSRRVFAAAAAAGVGAVVHASSVGAYSPGGPYVSAPGLCLVFLIQVTVCLFCFFLVGGARGRGVF